MGDAIPFFEDGDELTVTATAAIAGGQLVKLTGNVLTDGTFQAAPCGAGDEPLGVALFDIASGARGTVHSIESHHIVPIVTAVALTYGQSVKAGAAGVCTLSSSGDKSCGYAMTGAAGGGAAVAMIMLSRHVAA